jgi:hypothetical protein
MHDHFADDVVLAGMESETMPPDERALPSEEESGPRPGAENPQGDLETPAVDRPDVRE